jgi:hypothetical protein
VELLQQELCSLGSRLQQGRQGEEQGELNWKDLAAAWQQLRDER